MPEIAGEILLATNPNGRVWVQFSKNPFPLLIAQSAPHRWEVDAPPENKHYSGHGDPPKRLIFLYLPSVFSGHPPPKGWTWRPSSANSGRLENPSTGESLEVFFEQ